MPIADKQILLNRVAHELGNELTMNQLTTAMGVLTMNMDSFDVSYRGESQNDGAEMLDAFLSTKEIEGKSPKTIERYRYILNKMLKSVKVPTTSINVYHLRSYLTQRKASGLSDSTLRGERDIFCSFFGWLNREGLISRDPAGNLQAIKSQKKVRRPFSATDMERLMESCTTDRDKALISFLAATGCRVSEACSVNIRDVDFISKKLVVTGKGNKDRTVYLDEVAVMYIQRYLNGRKDKHEALFVGRGTTRMTPGGVRFALNKIAERSGVENVHPHRFRRTLATNLINHGMAIQEVAEILGHDKIDTTMTYVHVTQENVQTAYHKYR